MSDYCDCTVTDCFAQFCFLKRGQTLNAMKPSKVEALSFEDRRLGVLRTLRRLNLPSF